MKNESRTLYIPLYGKAYVSKKNIILKDSYAEQIWSKEVFPLKGKSKSKWLAYYMAMRSAFIDEIVQQKVKKDSCVLHLGCGLDARAQRLSLDIPWYDIDLNDVIEVRKQYFTATSNYTMLAADVSNPLFLKDITYHQHGVIVLEGLTMYLSKEILNRLFDALAQHFDTLDIILDAYSTLAIKAGKKRNPIKDVNAIATFGFDDGKILETASIHHIDTYHICQPQYLTSLSSWEQFVFKLLYTNRWTSKLYQIYTYQK